MKKLVTVHMKGRKPTPPPCPRCGGAGKRALFPVLAACLFALSACHPAILALGGASIESVDYMETRKTFPDRIISNVFDKDCAFSYYKEIKKLCRDSVKDITPPIYCYRTLGDVDCYNAPNPYDPRLQPVGGMAQQNRQKLLYQEYLEKAWPRLRKKQTPPPPPSSLDGEMEPAPNLPSSEGLYQG